MFGRARLIGVLVAAPAVLLLGSLTAGNAFGQGVPRGQVVWERESNCRNCHGEQNGQIALFPLAGTQRTAEEFIAQVRNPRNNMPAYSERQISDFQLRELHGYLQSLPVPTGLQRRDLSAPAGSEEGRRLLSQKLCVVCHAPGGAFSIEAIFARRGEIATPSAVLRQLRNPRVAMPAYNQRQVTDAEAMAIGNYLMNNMLATQARTVDSFDDALSAVWGDLPRR